MNIDHAPPPQGRLEDFQHYGSSKVHHAAVSRYAGDPSIMHAARWMVEASGIDSPIIRDRLWHGYLLHQSAIALLT